MSNSRSHLAVVQLLLLTLGFSLLIFGAYFPVISRQFLALGATINVGGGNPPQITVNGQSASLTIQCTSTGAVCVTVTVSGSGFTPSTSQISIIQYDSSRITQIHSTGTTASSTGTFTGIPFEIWAGFDKVIINAADPSKGQSNDVGLTITQFGEPQFGTTVTMEDGAGQTFSLLTTSNVKAKSPLYFRVEVIQGASSVQSMILTNYPQGNINAIATVPLTKGVAPQGSHFPSDQNSWYGTLTLAPGIYIVQIKINPTSGDPFYVISVLSYLNVPAPYDSDYVAGAGIMLVGALITLFAAFAIPSRRGALP
jgi:hypothetical protein